MDYRYNFETKKKGKFKKIIFSVVCFVIVIVISAFLFKKSNNLIINKVSTIISYPFTCVSTFAKDTFNNITSCFGNINKLNKEINNLNIKNTELELKVLEIDKILAENESLKKMLDIKKEYQHFEIKMASIIYREHDNWTQTFKINLGINDGIKINQTVVHKEGLVGFISSVEDSTSTVTTILDPISSVSVNISTINEPAILQGDLSLKSENKLKLTYIPIDTEISVSDTLYTSGLGVTYPSSIPVGKITEIVKKKNDINRYAIVKPTVNIQTIKEVGIIIN